MILINNRQYQILREDGPKLTLMDATDAQTLKDWRLAKGRFSHLERTYSQATAARILGVTQSILSMAEALKRPIPKGVMQKILEDSQEKS